MASNRSSLSSSLIQILYLILRLSSLCFNSIVLKSNLNLEINLIGNLIKVYFNYDVISFYSTWPFFFYVISKKCLLVDLAPRKSVDHLLLLIWSQLLWLIPKILSVLTSSTLIRKQKGKHQNLRWSVLNKFLGTKLRLYRFSAVN